jgi:hypothetical protein
MSAECRGINYALRLREGAVHVRPRLFRDKILAIDVDGIKSIELLRKSVMPPAVIGAVSLSLGLILGTVENELTAILPLVHRVASQYLAFAIALVSLVVLLSRWFFSDLTLRPLSGSPIVVRMVPTRGARRFVALIQGHTRVSGGA